MKACALAVVAGLSVATIGVSAQATVTVTVIGTADVHGRVTNWDYVNDREAPWGLSRVAAAVDSIRRAAAGPVIVLDAGDLIQGNPFAAFYATNPRRPHPIMDAMNAIGYDAITPGNHEFNFGLGLLDSIMEQATFPVVSANIYDTANRLVHDENALLERGGVRIGVTGFTTPGAMVWDRANLRGNRVVRPIMQEAAHALANLERDDAHLKIVLIHSGMDGGSSYDTTGVGPENVAAQLAQLPTKPDLVIVGHSHRMMTDSVIDGVHFIQPQQWAQSIAVARVTLGREGSGYQVQSIEAEQVSVASVAPDRVFSRRMESPHADVRNWLNESIARSTGSWSAQFARGEDSPLIDFINEVQRKRAGADLSSTAVFNSRAVLPAGNVRRRDVMGVYPYENTLKAVRITGNVLREYLERSASYFTRHPATGSVVDRTIPGYNYDIVSGVAYTIDVSQPTGSRIRGLAYGGQPVRDDQVFTLALNNYRQGGGGNYGMLTDLPVVYDRGENIRDLLVEEVTRVRRLDSAAYFNRSWNIIPVQAARAIAVSFGAGAEILSDRVTARVISTTDLMGSMEPVIPPWSENRPVGGQNALVRTMDSLEADCECPTLRVAAGDMLQGTLLSDGDFGRGVVDLMIAAGTDVAVPGGADFAWGLDTLAVRVTQSTFPWLAANVLLSNGAGRFDWLQPWAVIEKRDRKLAVIGIAADPLSADAVAAGVDSAIGFLDAYTAVRASLDEIATEDVDEVVLVAHLDAFCDQTGCKGALIDLMHRLSSSEIDLVVGGHSDTEASALINGIPLVLPGSFGLSVGASDFVEAPDGSRRVATSIATVWADEGTARVPFVTTGVGGIDDVVAEMRSGAGHTRGEQSRYGNLLADAYRNAARTQFAIVWNEDIGPGLSGGPMTSRTIHRVQPSRRGLMKMTLTGRELRELLEHSLADSVPTIHIAGFHVRIDVGRRFGDRVRRITFPGGDRLRNDDEYTVAVSDRLASGAYGFPLPVDLPPEPAGVSDFEALVRYLGRLRSPVEAPPDQRFISN